MASGHESDPAWFIDAAEGQWPHHPLAVQSIHIDRVDVAYSPATLANP